MQLTSRLARHFCSTSSHRSVVSAAALAVMVAVTGVSTLLAAESAQATVVVVHPLDEMAHRADVIVHAQVKDQRIVREEGRIITLTAVEVIEGIKGAKAGDILTVFQVGGKLDGEYVSVVGNSVFTPGEEMVFYAMRHRDRLVSYGVGLGKFVVDRDTSTVSIREDIGDVVAVDPSAPRNRPFKPTPRVAASLSDFLSTIRADLAAPRRRKSIVRD